MARSRSRPRKAPDNRSIVRRVRAVEVTQQSQGITLDALLASDLKRTEREQLVVTFITRVIPGGVAAAVAIVTGIVWLITHTK